MKAIVLAAAVLTLAGAASTDTASAQTFRHYPFCLFTGGPSDGFERCNYYTFQQCLYDRQAEGGVCYANPYYAYGPYTPRPRQYYR